jgi:hypothetical protein
LQVISRATAAASLGQSQREIAQELVDRVFDSMRRMNVQVGIVQDYSTPEEWHHRTTQDVEADLAYLEVHRPAIVAALSDYLADDSLRTREIDWLFLNLLTYAEYIATVIEIRKKLLGIDAYIKSLHPPKADHTPSISALASRPWHTFFASGATALFLVVHPALAVGVGALSLYWYMKRKQNIEKIDSLLSAMLRTYASFNTVDVSWSHVSRALEQSRLEGAVWDASLFKLAEARQGPAS